MCNCSAVCVGTSWLHKYTIGICFLRLLLFAKSSVFCHWMIDGCEMLSCPVWILFDNQMEMQSLSFPQLLFSRKFQIKFCKFQTPQSFIDTPVCLLIQFKSVSSVGFVCLSVFHPFCLFLRCTSTFSTQCRRYPSVDQFIW